MNETKEHRAVESCVSAVLHRKLEIRKCSVAVDSYCTDSTEERQPSLFRTPDGMEQHRWKLTLNCVMGALCICYMFFRNIYVHCIEDVEKTALTRLILIFDWELWLFIYYILYLSVPFLSYSMHVKWLNMIHMGNRLLSAAKHHLHLIPGLLMYKV